MRFRRLFGAIVSVGLAVWLVPTCLTGERADAGLHLARTLQALQRAHPWLDDQLGRSDEQHRSTSIDDSLEDAEEIRSAHTLALISDHCATSSFDVAFDLHSRYVGRPTKPAHARLLSGSRDPAAPRPPPSA